MENTIKVFENVASEQFENIIDSDDELHNGERECRAKWPEQEMAATALIDCWVFWVYTLCPMQR